MSKKFKHLNISPHWQQYFSKYPDGYTIIENLIDWVSQVDDMVDNQNKMNVTVDTFGDRLDEFIDQYDTHLQETVEQTLSDWQNSGFLNMLINTTLETKYHEMDERLTTQLDHTVRSKVDKDGSQQVTWANIAQDAREQITGDKVAVVGKDSVGTDNLTNNAVTYDKAAYLNQTRNLLDEREVTIGGYYNTRGEWNANASYNTVRIKVKNSGVHTTDFGTRVTYTSDVAFFDDDGSPVQSTITSDSWDTQINVPQGVRTVALSYAQHRDFSGAMFVEGNQLPASYIPYGYAFNEEIVLPKNAVVEKNSVGTDSLTNNAVTYDKTAYLNQTINLLNEREVTIGGYYNTWGVWNDNASYNTIRIKVKNSGVHTTDFGTRVVFRSDVAFFDDEGNSVQSNITNGTWDTQINVPEGVRTVALSYAQHRDFSGAMFVEGNQLPASYIPYGYAFNEEIVLPNNNAKTNGKKMLVFGDSITETSSMSTDGSNYVEGAKTNWPTYIKELNLGEFKNYALSGATYRNQGSSSGRLSIENQIDIALNMDSYTDIIVVSIGTNDGLTNLGSYEDAMDAPIDELDTTKTANAIRKALYTLREHYSKAQIYVATPIQRTSFEPQVEQLDLIKRMAKRYNANIIDANSESGIVRDFEVQGGMGRYLRDGLHPNEDGKVKMAELYTRVILNTYNTIN